VLYEMLAGEPPFSGPTTQAILARHRFDPVPPLRSVRPSVPPGVEGAILHALEKVPADRYTTTAQFVGALEALPAPAPGPAWWRRVAWSAGFAVAGLVIYLAIRGLVSGNAGSGAGRDTTRYAIMPFDRDSGLASFNEDQLLQDALLQWTGITVVDRPSMQEAVSRHGARLTSGDAVAIARRVGAGRYVLSQVSRVGDSLRINSAVYRATARGPPVHEGTVKVGRNLSQTGGAFSQIADRLLFGEAGPGARLDRLTGTTSRPARQAFAMGLDSVNSWNLTAADSAFNAATQYDPQYPVALLWLALVRSWNGAPFATWQSAAERAAARRERLTSRDQLLSDALLAIGRGDVGRACRLWERMTAIEPRDFAVWYGLANCLSGDRAVRRDVASPSGWAFRSSYFRATKAYQRAFQLLPAIHKALSAGSYASVRRLLLTSGSALRSGQAVPPDTLAFAAYPSWQSDTLAFVPHPERLFAGPAVVPETMVLAVRRERELFHDMATAWVSAFPESAQAMEALALSLELLGNPAALDTLRRARALATTPEERVRLAGTQVWMRVKFSLPSDSAGLRAAWILADSLLQLAAPPTARQPLLLTSLAALTGRAHLAAELSRRPEVVAEWEVPAPIVKTGGPLLAYAALGGPVDSVRALEREVDSVIDIRLVGRIQHEARMQWLGRPAALAFPHYRFRSLAKLVGGGNYLVNAEAAFLRGDTTTVRRVFADLQAARRSAPVQDLTFDALYPEAWLLGSLGDPRAAIAWLDPTLGSLSASAPQAFVNPANAGALVQAMVLRADLAEKAGDHGTAARWARAVIVLWRDADPFLQPVVRRMDRLARRTPGVR
jgi:tetratricopeptide (TPR) repeat protein